MTTYIEYHEMFKFTIVPQLPCMWHDSHWLWLNSTNFHRLFENWKVNAPSSLSLLRLWPIFGQFWPVFDSIAMVWHHVACALHCGPQGTRECWLWIQKEKTDFFLCITVIFNGNDNITKKHIYLNENLWEQPSTSIGFGGGVGRAENE